MHTVSSSTDRFDLSLAMLVVVEVAVVNMDELEDPLVRNDAGSGVKIWYTSFSAQLDHGVGPRSRLRLSSTRLDVCSCLPRRAMSGCC